jgi:hypothetical protein
MSKTVTTTIYIEPPDSGAAVTVSAGLLVADDGGYRIAAAGTAAALLTADGAGYRVETVASGAVVSARIIGFGNSYIVRPT